MKIELTTSASEQDLKTISKGIQAYNQIHMTDDIVFEPDTKFCVFARNDHHQIVGGVRAVAFWNYCIIELLWLSDNVRGKGIGSELMAKAESYAMECGFEYMRTETLSFQAKPFYQKLGYEVFGELNDHPKGHTTYCLVKKLVK